ELGASLLCPKKSLGHALDLCNHPYAAALGFVAGALGAALLLLGSDAAGASLLSCGNAARGALWVGGFSFPPFRIVPMGSRCWAINKARVSRVSSAMLSSDVCRNV